MRKKNLFYSLVLIALVLPSIVFAQTSKQNLSGQILLQVESRGEAWYVDPKDYKRTYLQDGAAAYRLLREKGVGIKNSDLSKIPVGIETRSKDTDSDNDGLADKLEEALGTDINNNDTDKDGYSDGAEVLSNYSPLGKGKIQIDKNLANQFKGKILLQIESRGEAWYVYPVDGKRYYLKDGDAAYQIMRFLSLGITNENLAKIEAVKDPFTFEENGKTFREVGSQFDSVLDLWFIKDKMAYLAVKDKKMVLVYDGREDWNVLATNASAFTGIILDINGKPAVFAIANEYGEGPFVYYEGKHFGTEYILIRDVADVNGKLAFTAIKKDETADGGGRYVIYYDGKEYGTEYFDALFPFELDGKLTFLATKNFPKDTVVQLQEDGMLTEPPLTNEIGADATYIYDQNNTVVHKITGALRDHSKYFDSIPIQFYSYNLDNPYKLVYKGQEVNHGYKALQDAAEINGKLAYIGVNEFSSDIVYDDLEYGKAYASLIDKKKPLIDSTAGFSFANSAIPFIRLNSKDGKLIYHVSNSKQGHFIVMEQ